MEALPACMANTYANTRLSCCRYKIRGAQTVLFYAPPEHADFYAEYLQYPFLKRERPVTKGNAITETTEEVLEAEEVSCQTVFSKYDFLKLQRIVGTHDARIMCKKEGRESYSFA
jgi:U3 small nucleolar RNA-associated protein 25